MEECNDHIEKYNKMEKLIQAQVDGKISPNDLVAKSKLLFPAPETPQPNNSKGRVLSILSQ